MTFKTHYEPVPVTEAGKLNDYELFMFDDGSSACLPSKTPFTYPPVAVYRPRPDTVLLTREEVEEIKKAEYQKGLNDTSPRFLR